MIIQAETFTLRPVREDEMALILEVYRQCEDFLALTPKPIASMEIVKEDLALSRQNGGVFCGIFDTTGIMMGVLDVVFNGFDGDLGSAFIELLMIGKPYRQKGLGAAVVKTVEAEIMRDTRVNAIWAAVMVNNPADIRFWKQQWYTIVGEPEHEPDGTTVWKLKKPILSR